MQVLSFGTPVRIT